MPYSRIAHHYHLLERLTMWSALQQARVAHLDQLQNHGIVQNALLLGEGNGSFLLSFTQRYPHAEVTVIDSCPVMIETAQKRLQKSGQSTTKIHFQQADLRDIDLPRCTYDLIVTHFFFDNFDQPTVDKLVAKIANAATSKAQWLWSDFQIPAQSWQTLRARLWLKVLYLFFGRVASVSVRQLPDAEQAIIEQGFRTHAIHELCGQLLRTNHFARTLPTPLT